MSTRCQIGFYPDNKTPLKKWDALIYRHSDGYPGNPDKGEGGVLTDLLPLCENLRRGRRIGDTEYSAAYILYKMKDEYIKSSEELRRKMGWNEEKTGYHNSEQFLGFGICRSLHGDIEYFYAISPEGIRVYDTPFDSGFDDFELIKTVTFEPIAEKV